MVNRSPTYQNLGRKADVITIDKAFRGSGYDYGWSVQQTADGEYIITGEIGSYGAGDYAVLLIKTDEDGNVD